MKPELLINFGNRVRNRRKQLRMSQEELAARADVHRTYIGMIERAEKNITLQSIVKICKALDISISKFFEDFDNE